MGWGGERRAQPSPRSESFSGGDRERAFLTDFRGRPLLSSRAPLWSCLSSVAAQSPVGRGWWPVVPGRRSSVPLDSTGRTRLAANTAWDPPPPVKCRLQSLTKRGIQLSSSGSHHSCSLVGFAAGQPQAGKRPPPFLWGPALGGFPSFYRGCPQPWLPPSASECAAHGVPGLEALRGAWPRGLSSPGRPPFFPAQCCPSLKKTRIYWGGGGGGVAQPSENWQYNRSSGGSRFSRNGISRIAENPSARVGASNCFL